MCVCVCVCGSGRGNYYVFHNFSEKRQLQNKSNIMQHKLYSGVVSAALRHTSNS